MNKAAFEPDSDEDHGDLVSDADHATWTIRQLSDGLDDIDPSLTFLEIDRLLRRSEARTEATHMYTRLPMIKRRVPSLRRQDSTCAAGWFDLTHRAHDGEQGTLKSIREGRRTEHDSGKAPRAKDRPQVEGSGVLRVSRVPRAKP